MTLAKGVFVLGLSFALSAAFAKGSGKKAKSGDAAGKAEASAAPTPAPNFKITDVDGKEVELSALKGKTVLLDFWATWCPPCRQEVPGFVELYESYKDKGLVVVGIALEQNNDPAALKQWLVKNKVSYPVAIDAEHQVTRLYGEVPGTEGIQGIPTTLLIDREGAVRQVWVGGHPKETFEKAILPLLKEEKKN